MKFSELDLHPLLNAGIERLGFSDVTPVQELTIPPILEGKDIAGLAQTGTGKTAAFLLPLMERIVRSRLNPEQLSEEERAKREARLFPDWRSNQFVLVLVPTRELAEQVYENALKLKGDSEIRAVSIYGGVSYDRQKQGLRDGVEFVIATPGRLIDLYKDNLVDLKQVRAIVFDEADRMFDMGFKDDMKFILQRVPKGRQFLVFSATLNLDVLNTAYQFGANPVEVNVSRDQAKAENVEDKIFHVGQEEKGAHLLSLLRLHQPRQAIIFSNFKMNVPRITQFLNDNGLPTVGISSLLTQSQRNRVMEQFKGESDHNILVATDVAARGLDIKGVDMVVNFELPDDPENYVHRIGRTGRAGAKGIAFSLVSDRDIDALSRVESYLKHKVETGFLEESELVKEYKSMPSDREARYGSADRGGRGPGGGGRSSGRGTGRGVDDRSGGRSRRSESRPETRDRRPRSEPYLASAGDGHPSSRSPSGSQSHSHSSHSQGRSQQQTHGGGQQRQEQGQQNNRRAGRDRDQHGGRGGGERREQQARGGQQPASRDARHSQNGQGSQHPHGSSGSSARRGDRKHHDQRREGQRPQQKSHSHQQGQQNRRHEQGHHQAKAKASAASAQASSQASLGQKVSGFFKRLFGG